MQEHDGESCTICGEPATTYLGQSKCLPLCSLPACERALENEINMTLDETASDNNEGAQP